MNIFYLAIIILIIFIYTNYTILRKNNKLLAILLFIISLFFIIIPYLNKNKNKYIELSFMIIGLSIIIFFKKEIKEKYNDYGDIRRDELLGQQLINNMYNNYNIYPKIDKTVKKDHNLISNNTDIDKKYKKISKNIIQDDKYLVKNIYNQVEKYGKQNQLNDKLYNSEYGIYHFQNDQTVETQSTDEWKNKYKQLQDDKTLIQDQINDNSGEILDLQKDNKIISQELQNKRDKLRKLRIDLNQNLNKIKKNQKCLGYGMGNITKKYLQPEKQNIHYGEIKAPERYSSILDKKVFSVENILDAYQKNPDLMNNCIKEIIGNDDDNHNNDNKYSYCDSIVEKDQINLSPNRIFYDF